MMRVKIEPIYKSFAGWNIPTGAANSVGNLPQNMKTYVDFINKYLGVNIHYISNGPGRDQIISIP